MDYKLLADVYAAVEGTSKRLEKTAALANFLKQVSDEELEHIILLLQARAFPTWEKETLGIASRVMLKTLASVLGTSELKLETAWKEEGDLALVAEKFAAQRHQTLLFKQPLTTKKVFETLRKIASTEGSGSTDTKVKLLSEIFSLADAKELRYVVRTVLEDLRIGLADSTLRDAIVWASFPQRAPSAPDQEPTDREAYKAIVALVQDVFDRTTDFAQVAVLARKGEDALRAVKLKIGDPIKLMLASREPSFTKAFERTGVPAQLEYKYDGFRCITGHTPIFTLEAGLISMKDVQTGMHVLTHKGRYKPVIGKHSRVIDKSEKIYDLQSWLGHKFSITEGHKLLIWRKNQIAWFPVDEIIKNDRLFFPYPSVKVESPFGVNLELRDEAGYVKRIPINPFFFRFLGYWLGDGFTNEHHNTERVGLVFNNAKGKELCKEYEANLRLHFGLSEVSKSVHNGGLYLYFRDKPLRIWLSTHFRREWRGKFIPAWLQGISKTQFTHFLKGWCEADGHTDAQGRTSITTKERDVAAAAQMLALRHRILLGVKKFRVNNKTYYRITLCKTDKTATFMKNGLAVRILQLEQKRRPNPRMRVYDIQVKDDSSYCTTLLTLHNCQIHKKGDTVTLFTRRLENVTAAFPDLVEIVRERVLQDCLLDAEAIGIDPATGHYVPFQQISQRIRRKHRIEELVKEMPMQLAVFDVLVWAGEEVLQLPQAERFALLQRELTVRDLRFTLSTHVIASTPEEAQAFFAQSKAAGCEGIMVKSLTAPYRPGARVGDWVKQKETMENLDLVIIGAEWGEGKRSGWLTSFELAVRAETGEFLGVGRVGTGLKELASEGLSFGEVTELLRPHILLDQGKVVTVSPAVVVEVAYEEIQRSPSYPSGFALRFPRVIRNRTDERGPEDVTSLAYLEQLFAQQ